MQHPVAIRTAARLRTIREQWGALLAAVETPPAPSTWPPAETRAFLNTGAADDGALLVEDRTPLTLRQHPAPANLDALDACLFVEQQVFDLADTLAATVQHAGVDDPRRWTFVDPGAPDARTAIGSRAHGLHWAALFIEGRVLDEDTEPELLDGRLMAAPYSPLPEWALDEAARVARACEQRVARIVAADAITGSRTLPTPCPACGGALVVRAALTEPPTVTCRTGEACGADTSRDARGRRVWEWPACLPLLLANGQAEDHEQRAA
ncbi:hypothetical protein [Streptomyces sp. FIT100]|uniref:hypothetical protein n=1 Tax=Streptomyces sp. FIT100 TaxID=2837956 RepID=UPI0021C6DDF4|nr:hypothetical protein [Streptomyces sp. FIT100]UUN29443.1 hypothetical protein KK483_25990 [Streptomyces sp. FIT100]